MQTRYHYNMSDQIMIMQLIGVSKISTRHVVVDVIYSEIPYFSVRKREIMGEFWARSELVTGRADKINIIRRKFE